jgi:MmyB-like transcription regulator ligand binding domain
MDVARGGASRKVKVPVDELCRLSPEFAAMWRDNDVYTRGEGTKSVRHPIVRLIALEYSAFAVDGQPDLGKPMRFPASKRKPLSSRSRKMASSRLRILPPSRNACRTAR